MTKILKVKNIKSKKLSFCQKFQKSLFLVKNIEKSFSGRKCQKHNFSKNVIEKSKRLKQYIYDENDTLLKTTS